MQKPLPVGEKPVEVFLRVHLVESAQAEMNFSNYQGIKPDLAKVQKVI